MTHNDRVNSELSRLRVVFSRAMVSSKNLAGQRTEAARLLKAFDDLVEARKEIAALQAKLKQVQDMAGAITRLSGG